MDYKEFLDYIYLRHSGNVKLGLERMEKILEAMDFPNLKMKGIHIAGTNGKGSTAAMCEAISTAHGIRTGLNTSPHLVDYRERIRLNSRKIGKKDLINLYRSWEEIFSINEASFFEITTALAFKYFHREKVDNAIFEVGLGGRLDGTNPFRSTVTVITSISYDHTKSLGSSITKIATEKAGILKEGVPLVTGRLSARAYQTIKTRAAEKNVEVYRFGRDFDIANIKSGINGTEFDYSSEDLELTSVRTNLLGVHQAHNAALALKASELFFKRTGRKTDPGLLLAGLNSVDWIGRLQVMKKRPRVLIDGAHNEEGIRSLIASLESIFPGRKFIFVLAILRDKKLNQIFMRLARITKRLYIARNRSNRAAEIELQEKYALKYSLKYRIIPNVVNATRIAVEDAGPEEIIVITGSLYTISEVLEVSGQLF